MTGKLFFSILVPALVVAGGAAFAAQNLENDALALGQAKISLIQAVTAAEQQSGGRASKAEYEHSKKHGWVYDVEVVAGTKVFDIKVDAQNGAVLASALDASDHDDDHDKRD